MTLAFALISHDEPYDISMWLGPVITHWKDSDHIIWMQKNLIFLGSPPVEVCAVRVLSILVDNILKLFSIPIYI